jgi:ribosomal protein L29
LNENANLVENVNIKQPQDSQNSLKLFNPNLNNSTELSRSKSYVISEMDNDLLNNSTLELSTLRHDLAVVNLELREKSLEIEQTNNLKQQIFDLKTQLETEIDRNQKN